MHAERSTSADRQTFAASWPSQPDWWTHATTDWVAVNERAHRVCVAECQTFAGRRLEKVSHLLRELTSAKAPVEVWSAWHQFW
jgi:hypothetical protein